VIIEANACKTPAIATDRVPAAVNGLNAIVVPCFNVDLLSKGMVCLLSNDKTWLRFSASSFEWAKKYTWVAAVNRFVALIDKVVG